MRLPAYRPRVGVVAVLLSVPADMLLFPAPHPYAGGLFLAVFLGAVAWSVYGGRP